MFGFRYFKGHPTQYVFHYVDGRKRKAGAGISFFYYSPTSTIVVVPLASVDVPFIFNQVTADFQQVTVQGQLTYRIIEPEKTAETLDYSVGLADYVHASEDPEKLSQRLVHLAQVLTRLELDKLPLREAIRAADRVASGVDERIRKEPSVGILGVELLGFSIVAIRPSPEMARALEAETRETLLKQADDAIYLRRNSAIEQERRIKENELSTEMAVEEKQRLIREIKAEADLAIENKEQAIREARLQGEIGLEDTRRQLVEARVANIRTEADAQAYAVEASLNPLKQLDPGLLEALTLQTAEPRLMIANAIRELAQNAGKIGQLNISPELLENLLKR